MSNRAQSDIVCTLIPFCIYNNTNCARYGASLSVKAAGDDTGVGRRHKHKVHCDHLDPELRLRRLLQHPHACRSGDGVRDTRGGESALGGSAPRTVGTGRLQADCDTPSVTRIQRAWCFYYETLHGPPCDSYGRGIVTLWLKPNHV